jgi:hypothetical protein
MQTDRGMPEHTLKTPHPSVPVHIREIIPVWILFAQPSYVYVYNTCETEHKCILLDLY